MKLLSIFIVSPVVLLSYLAVVSSLSFNLPPGQEKCLREEVHKDVLVTGEYRLSDAPHQKTHLTVTDSTGHVLYKKEDATKGKFAFTTDDYDMYKVCLESEVPRLEKRVDDDGNSGGDGDEEDNVAFKTTLKTVREIGYKQRGHAGGGVEREVTLNVKHGVEAKNYEDLAKAEKLKPMEVELKRLEDLADAVVNDFAYMRQREQEMRDTNESTYSRVLYFSIFSILCLFGLATWQLFYLRRFFIAKKLIE